MQDGKFIQQFLLEDFVNEEPELKKDVDAVFHL
jgi:hypothetical protein